MSAGIGAKVRVVVAEDSETVRLLIVEILSREPDIQVVAEAHDGIEAVELVRRLKPDVVAMDVNMPRLDGFFATIEIMRTTPTPVVLVTGLDLGDVERAMRALETGAVAAVAKPVNPSAAKFEQRRRELVETVRAMAGLKVVRHHAYGQRPPAPPQTTRARIPADLVAIAASTGGPPAIRDLLKKLGPDRPPPMVVVQHLSPGFVEGLARWLTGATAIECRIACEGEPLERGRAYFAPDDRHLGVSSDGRILLLGSEPIGRFRPSASVLFETVAGAYGARALAVVLTGMGDDGLAGLRVAHKRGTEIIAQDEASALVYGMPQAAVREGLADAVLTLDEIAEVIRARARPQGQP